MGHPDPGVGVHVAHHTLLVAGGLVCGAAGMPWGLVPVLLTTLVGWLLAARTVAPRTGF